MLAPLGFVLVLSFGIDRISAGTATLLFWIYGVTSLYGFTTGADLSRFGSFLFMGLIGIVIASLVNIFTRSDAVQFVISILGVKLFVGLTAYDTQRIKAMYLESDTEDLAGKKAVMGALALYLDFVNLFMLLLQLFGQRRQN